LRNYFGTRPFTALARALQVMRPAASAASRARRRRYRLSLPMPL
jgi:hypothetical protein